jgi:methyl-accepting chemotaxis protein
VKSPFSTVLGKLLAVWGVSIALVLTGALIGAAGMMDALDDYQTAIGGDLAHERAIQSVETEFKLQVQEWKNVLLRGSEPEALAKYWGQFEATEKKVQQAVGELAKRVEEPAVRGHLEAFSKAHQEMAAGYRKGLEAYKAAGFDSKVGDKAVKGIDRAPAELLEKAAQGLAAAVNASTAHAQTAERRALVWAVAAIVIAVAAGLLGFVYLTRRSVTHPAKQLAADLRRMAEGDFTAVPVYESNDELGDIGASAGSLRRDMGGVIAYLLNATTQMAAAAEELARTSDDARVHVSRQQSETALVATAINEMAATAHEVAKSAADTAQASHRADGESREGKAVVGRTVRAIDALAGEVENAAGVIQRLEVDTESIGRVVEVIRGIAEQTNLLALNAAIEAARAGEQGRGFAVVADEVRTLASRTQQSTREIQEMIERLQTGAKDAVAVMEKGRVQARASVEQAGTAGVSLESITQAVATINDMTAQIASAAEEQTHVTEEINRNVTQIAQAVEATAQGAEQTAAAGEELARIAAELQASVGRFRI